MVEIACNTSPLQYLHQLGLLEILPAMADSILVPPAVVAEIAAGWQKGIDLPDLDRLLWVTVCPPLGPPCYR